MERYCINQSYTIKETIESIERLKDRVVIVVDNNDKVIGIISQGDVIRALLAGKNLYTQVQSIVRPNFFYLNSRDLKKAYELFKKYQITLLPVVDENFQLLEVISMKDIYNYLEDLCKN